MRLPMLGKRADFLRVKSGVNWGTKGFSLQAAWQIGVDPHNNEQTQLGRPRFGITVSNHSIRRMLNEKSPQKPQSPPKPHRRGPVSVQRNRARRRLRAALQKLAPSLAQNGVDYVLVGRPALETLSFEIILKDLEKSFQKVHRRLISTNN